MGRTMRPRGRREAGYAHAMILSHCIEMIRTGPANSRLTSSAETRRRDAPVSLSKPFGGDVTNDSGAARKAVRPPIGGSITLRNGPRQLVQISAEHQS